MGEAKRRKIHGKDTLSDPAVAHGLIRHAFARTCETLVAAGDDLSKALHTFYTGRNLAFDTQAAALSRASVGCRLGCHACCHQMVLCYPYEIFVLADLLLQRPKDELDEISATFRARLNLPLTPESCFGVSLPCPLLTDGRCSVYSRRPMTCRALYSASRQACDNALVSDERSVAYLHDPQMMATAFNLGIGCALRQKRGLDIEMVEMGGAVLTAIDDLDATFALWCKGGAPFSAFQARPAHMPSQAELSDALVAGLGL